MGFFIEIYPDGAAGIFMRRRRGGPGTALHCTGAGDSGEEERESGGARGALEAQAAIKKIMQELRSRTRHESD